MASDVGRQTPPNADIESDADELTGAARRQQNRKLRRSARQEEQASQARQRLLRRTLAGLMVIVAVVGLVYVAAPPIIASYNRVAPGSPGTAPLTPIETAVGTTETGYPGLSFPDEGRDHIKKTDARPAYRTVPPTSGPHWEDWPKYGIYDEPLPEEWQVHHLEHGGIMIQYNCPERCYDLADQLATVARRYRYKVILAPYTNPALSRRVALTAWRRLDTFDDFNEARIVEFIDAYRNKGPEAYPDDDRDIKR